jgi:16S rRNA (guanine527-N7)-methyltransferase
MSSTDLSKALARARAFGFLGPGPVDHQIEHSRDLATSLEGCGGKFLDLGSGGGLPGLVLAASWPDSEGVLLDANHRRCEFLEGAVDELGLSGRFAVVCDRAELAAHRDELREQFDLVVARSFGPPPVVAECAVGFLRVGGRLAVSEPESGQGWDGRERWPAESVRALGLGPPEVRRRGESTVAILPLERLPDARWPRRVGVPAKRPLW